MSTDTLSCMDIDLSISHVSPSDQLITLTYGQLQDLIQEATERAMAPLEARILQLEEERGRGAGGGEEALQALRDRLEALEEATAKERAYDRQRIARLEHKEPGKTVLSRVEKIEKYLSARPDRRATFEVLKGHLGINNVLLGDAIEALMKASPGRYAVGKANGDKRQRVLIMLPKY